MRKHFAFAVLMGALLSMALCFAGCSQSADSASKDGKDAPAADGAKGGAPAGGAKAGAPAAGGQAQKPQQLPLPADGK